MDNYTSTPVHYRRDFPCSNTSDTWTTTKEEARRSAFSPVTNCASLSSSPTTPCRSEKNNGRRHRKQTQGRRQLRYVTLRYVTLRYVTLRYVTLRYVTLRYVTLRYVTLRYVAICYVALRCVTLHCVLCVCVRMCQRTRYTLASTTSTTTTKQTNTTDAASKQTNKQTNTHAHLENGACAIQHADSAAWHGTAHSHPRLTPEESTSYRPLAVARGGGGSG
jgi:hypothetical protein